MLNQRIKKRNDMKTYSKYVTKLLSFALAFGISISSFAQLTEQASMAVKGNYDIKMISSAGLQPAWISSTNPMTVVELITEEQMNMAGDDLALNNRYDWGLTGKPAQAALCPVGATGVSQVYADCDEDMNTFQSSAAFLDYGNYMGCTEVYKAFLYWNGLDDAATSYAAYSGVPTMRSHAGGATGNARTKKQVKFKTPGMTDYIMINADRAVTKEGTGRYVYMADVTAHVKGKPGGLYWVADLASSCAKGDGGASAGWSLVVIYTYPDCPSRVIKFWDAGGKEAPQGGGSITLNFAAGEVPASGNSISYLGMCGLDAEDTPGLLMDKTEPEATMTQDAISQATFAIAEKNRVVFNGGNGDKIIQPFTSSLTGAAEPDQAPIHACNEKAVCGDRIYRGFMSSLLTTYDAEKETNGNEIVRLPNLTNTLGFDAHHMRLPSGAMKAGATSAKFTLPSEQNGDYSLFMAYMAIEVLQAQMKLRCWSDAQSVQVGGPITYKLSAYNIGTLESSALSIVNPLDKTLNFVEGSVKFYDKAGNDISSKCTFRYEKNSEDDETLYFTLPSVGADKDSILILFDANVVGAERTDIWSYGCNRQVKNRGELTYINAAGESVAIGSNSDVGCEGRVVYYKTNVVDEALEQAYLKSHCDTLDLSKDANAAGKKVIVALRDRLRVKLGELGLNTSDADLYTFYDDADIEVGADEMFDVSGGALDFVARAMLDGGCEEEYKFNVKVAKRPTIDDIPLVEDNLSTETTLANGWTTYKGNSDGTIKFTIRNGNLPYQCTIYDESGKEVYRTYVNTEDANHATTIEVAGFPSGKYTLNAVDSKGFLISSTYTINDPLELNAEITGNQLVGNLAELCKRETLTLTSSASNRDNPDALTYAWQRSDDKGATWTTLSGFTTKDFVKPGETEAYMLRSVACENNNTVQIATAPIEVLASPTPNIEVVPEDVVCGEYIIPTTIPAAGSINSQYKDYLEESRITEISGEEYSRPNLTIEYYADPERTQELVGSLKATTRVYPRVYENTKCVFPTNETEKQVNMLITVKDMDDDMCYPIEVLDMFSPDGDDINDQLTIKCDNLDMYSGAEIIVFDRYGKKVHESKMDEWIQTGVGDWAVWDGKYHGIDLPSADYWYQLSFNEIRPRFGHFSLKRRRR
jgi:gliding motility-associated-like protein/uncharacterized repeat protein (TIGR01451 family)